MRRLLVNEKFKDITVDRLLKLGYTDVTFREGMLPFAPWVSVDIVHRTFKCCRYSVGPGAHDYWHCLRWNEFTTIVDLVSENKPLQPYIDSLNQRYKDCQVTEFPENS